MKGNQERLNNSKCQFEMYVLKNSSTKREIKAHLTRRIKNKVIVGKRIAEEM